MEIKVINANGKAAASITCFGRFVRRREYNEALIHQIVTAYQANARSGNRKTKRAQRNRKKYSQALASKGYWGPARAGMASSPLWRGGGKIFPNSPDENFSQKSIARCIVPAWPLFFSQLVVIGTSDGCR